MLRAILLLLASPAFSQLVPVGWTALGDSFSAGIGAGDVAVGDADDCRRRKGAFPVQLHTSGSNIWIRPNAPIEDLNFIACSGAETKDIDVDNGAQINKFIFQDPTMKGSATISIGGNDVGFADVIDACVFYAQKSDCDGEIAIATQKISTVGIWLTGAYDRIWQAAKNANRAPDTFKLFVVGYPEFFNEVTVDCNKRYMNFYPLSLNKAYLTIPKRQKLNELVRLMNDQIRRAVHDSSQRAENGPTVYVHASDRFTGHRFCEDGVVEPDNQRPGTWIFLLNGADSLPDGSIVDPPDISPPQNISPDECNTILQQETHTLGDDFGKTMICGAKRSISQGEEIPAYLNSTGDFGDTISHWERYAKAFHPKTAGHQAIRQAIEDAIQSKPDIPGWEFLDCYTDSNIRTLPGPSHSQVDMTPFRCMQFCRLAGYGYFGVEAGTECYCGSVRPDNALFADPATCDTPCGGDASINCGGGWRIAVYRRTTAVPTTQPLDDWTYDNCYTDDWVRTLSVTEPSNTQLTPDACAAVCVGHAYFGLEAGTECYCGDTIDSTKLASDPTTCNAPCTGQPSFVCGGGWRLSVYRRNPAMIQTVPGWQNISCYQDSATRTLNGVGFPSEPDMTPEKCAQLCCGWRYSGVEYGAECFCGNTIDSSLAAPAEDCNVRCAGDDHYECGGGWRLSVYQDLPGDAPGCASSCDVIRSCEQDHCNGSFDLATGIATCKGAFLGCPCAASPTVCGAPLSCDLNNCTGTFDADGRATCKGFFAGCECSPTPLTCGGVFSCDFDNCAGTFDLGDGKAYCTNSRRGCPCTSTGTTCGTPLSCDMNNCAGTFSMTDGRAYCSNFFQGCPCLTTETTCGQSASCDSNNCAGQFDLDNGRAYCQKFFQGCECTATATTCGPPQSCDNNNCWGSFNIGNGQAYCQGFFSGCQCQASYMTCGDPQSCDANNCQGAFDLNSGIAYCTNYFNGCRCQATDNTCGAWQSCDANGCDGTYDTNGIARCGGKFAGCRCNPTSNTCGFPSSCDGNGCNGGWDSEGVARCRDNFANCPCVPTQNTCGAQQPCANNGCNGRADGAGQGWCQDRYAGCACDASTATPGYCGILTTCSWSGCQGVDVGQQFGRCRAASHYDCTCILPTNPNPPPSPLPAPPLTDCVTNCQYVINDLQRLPSYVCSYDPIFSYFARNFRNGVDYRFVGTGGQGSTECVLTVAKSASENGFPDQACFQRSDLEQFVRQNALGCLSGNFFRTTYPQFLGQFVGDVQLCLSGWDHANECGTSYLNGAVPISG